MSDRDGRTEKPTSRRLRKAREEGRFAVSRDLTGACQFLTFAILVSWCGAEWAGATSRSFRALLELAFRGALGIEAVAAAAAGIAGGVFLPLAAGGLAVAGATLGAQLALTGGGVAPKRLAPDFKRLNPAARLREMPKENAAAFLKSVVLLPLFAWALYGLVADRLAAFLTLPLIGVREGIAETARTLISLFWKAALVFLAAGAFDYWRQRSRYMAGLKMTKQEVREEAKEMEANPQIKARIRRLARDLVRRRMMAQVPKAAAVIVNPTHYAVALRYSLESAGAPSVVAKGKNFLAQRIRRKAIQHEIPIIENPPLAQTLYRSVEVGQEIPPHLYRAVAEVLAYVYRVMGGRLPG